MDAGSRSLFEETLRILEASPHGLLTSVDARGVPFARWMTPTTDGGGLRRLLCLSTEKARKVGQIEAHPYVCWVFGTPDKQEVVTLYGHGSVDRDLGRAGEVWDRLVRAGRQSALSSLCRDEDSLAGMVTLVTEIERIELLSKPLHITWPKLVSRPV